MPAGSNHPRRPDHTPQPRVHSTRRARLSVRSAFRPLAALAAASALVLTGCATDAGASDTTLTFRLWDDTVASAYEASFDEFEKENPGITVETKIVPWEEYWTSLRTDIADETMDDVFWVNNAVLETYAESGNLVDVDRVVDTEVTDDWQPSVAEQFTHNDTLWAVPQTYDAGIALYYNNALLTAAGITPEQGEAAVWSTDPAIDTFLPLAKQLTVDAAGVTAATEGFSGDPVQFGTNLAYDLQAILLPTIGSNGGQYQKGDEFTFTDPATVDAVTYLTSAINTAKVAPSAELTNVDGEFSKQRFLDGSLALFQSGTYSLKDIAEGADFDWGIAPIPAGREGRVSVTNGIAAAGNAASEHPDAVKKLLRWLGSEDGNTPLGQSGAAIPAVMSAQGIYVDYWRNQSVNVAPFFEVVENGAQLIAPPQGGQFSEGLAAYDPIMRDIFTGKLTPPEGLKRAQDAANAAITN